MNFTIVDVIKSKIRGTLNLKELINNGLIIGENFDAQEGVIIDPGHCWLIEIGDNVTLAPRVHILAHDASTKKAIGYTRLGKVYIGNNVFVGAGSIILPGVTIGDDVVIGAGSIVTKDMPGGGIYAGNPAKKICDYSEWIENRKKEVSETPVFDESYVIGIVTEDKKKEMKDAIDDVAYIV